MRYSWFPGLLLLLALAGCGSSPLHHHTLAVIPPNHPVTEGKGLHQVRIGEVDVPPSLDRSAMVTRASPTSLDVHQQDVWAAPLGGMMQRTLSGDLAARLGGGQVLAVDDPTSPPGTRTITVSVRDFIAGPNGQVVLDTDWTEQGRNAPTTPHHTRITVQGSGTTPDAVAAAMSEALAQLSDQIAAKV